MKKDSIFYQSKFEYYRDFNKWVVIAACASSVLYFISDCFLFKQFTMATFIPRISILLPLFVFLLVNHFVRDYRVLIPLSYLVGHCIMLTTIWTSFLLPDLSYTSDGFLIINLAFLALGISAPIKFSIIGHALLFVDISVANIFLEYPSYVMMLALGLPCFFGICIFQFAIEKSFLDQYKSRQKIESDLIHDQLTGVYNRKVFDSLVNNQGIFYEYPKKDLCILLFDIDFFKNVNDTYGHEKGDEVLKFVADTTASLIRSGDKLVRWGGEEFVLVLPSCPLYGAEHKAEVIRKSLEESPENAFHITVSVGVAQYMGENYTTAIEHADEAMYAAKKSGRNRVSVYSGESVKKFIY